MVESDYITVDEAPRLLSNWEPGFSGTSWFKVDKRGYEWQAYWLEFDKLVSFVPAFSNRIPQRLTRAEFEERFND